LAKEPGQRPQSARTVAEWIGLELGVKSSAESLAAALFPQTPSRPAVAGKPARKGRSWPTGYGRKLTAVGIAALVMAAAFWLKKDILRHDHSNAPVSGKVPTPTGAEVQTPLQRTVTSPVATAGWSRGLVLYFSFDEPPKSGVVRDESGSGNDGWVVNARWTVQGQRGGAFQFSRTNSYITVPNQPSLNPSQITVAAWIKTSYSDSVYRRILDKGCMEGWAV